MKGSKFNVRAKNALAKNLRRKGGKMNISCVVSKLCFELTTWIRSFVKTSCHEKVHAKTRGISSSGRSSPQTPAAKTMQQLNTILCEGTKTLTEKPATTDSAPAFGWSNSLSSSQVKIWAPFVCLWRAETPEKERGSLVADSSFRRGLEIKVNFYTVQNKT